MNKKILFGVILSAFVLLTTPSLASVVQKTESLGLKDVQKEEIIEPKQLLFQTLEDIVNDPEVNTFLSSHPVKIELKNKLSSLSRSYEFRTLLLKLLFKNPRILFSIIRTKVTITDEYFDFAYTQGREILSALSNSELESMMTLVISKNSQTSTALSQIIMNKDNLEDKVMRLSSMNCDCTCDLNSNTLESWSFPFICYNLFILFGIVFIIWLLEYFIDPPPSLVLGYLMDAILGLAEKLNCAWIAWPP